MMTIDEAKDLLTELSEIILEEVPIAEYRKNILKRFDAVSKRLRQDSAAEDPRAALRETEPDDHEA
jgi:hypothetical protein